MKSRRQRSQPATSATVGRTRGMRRPGRPCAPHAGRPATRTARHPCSNKCDGRSRAAIRTRPPSTFSQRRSPRGRSAPRKCQRAPQAQIRLGPRGCPEMHPHLSCLNSRCVSPTERAPSDLFERTVARRRFVWTTNPSECWFVDGRQADEANKK